MKHNKLFAMLAVAAALAVSGCTGPAGESSTKHVHTAAADAPWQHDNNNHWKDCEANDGGKAENAKHTFGDPTDVVPATCQAAGSQKVKCTVCGAEVTQTLPIKDHTWGEWETVTAATCTEAGSRKHTCSVCQTEETETVQATGHTWGEWETVNEADCDHDGSRKHTCTVCGVEESETVEKLGHELELVGGETPAPTGEATVRLYRCKRCGETSLGFAADEPSEASLPHLMKGDHDGMRFFGRPIGNALALTADGTSVKQENNECVYCSTETGDFFEYVFTLNADQAATLATARLYCDARPADYLSGDFWAYNRSSDDWTPGFYIDGADDHVQKDATTGEVVMIKDHAPAVKQEDGSWAEGVELETEVKAGARIEDYRYILYVDGQPVDFDPDTSVPAKGSNTNMTRAEYVLPYTFNLHEGKNTISLRMAGGYRSEFYNFIFRPYEAPTPITVNQDKIEIREGQTAQITSSMEGLKFASSSNSIATVDENGVVTGVKAGTATITVSKDGNYKDAKVPVTVLEKEGIINIDLLTGVVTPEGSIDVYNSSTNGVRLRNFTKDGVITYTFQSEKAGLYNLQLRGSAAENIAQTISVKMNDADVAIAGALTGSTYSPSEVVIGQAELKVGENKLEIKVIAESTQLVINGIKLFPHVHEWVDDTAVAGGDGKVGYQPAHCASGELSRLQIAALDENKVFASGSSNKSGTPAPYLKLGGDGQSVTFTFNYAGEQAAAKLAFVACMDGWGSASNKAAGFYNGDNTRMEITVNGTVIDQSALKGKSYETLFEKGETNSLGSSYSNVGEVEMGAMTLKNGENTITIKRVVTLNPLVSYINIYF